MAIIAIGLDWLARKSENADDALVEAVNRVLPQTQCGQCQYPGCRPYAQAIVHDHVAINRCPPGGQDTIDAIAEIMGDTSVPLDAHYGQHKLPQWAQIDEARCIGCTKCIDVCPVDAIVGAQQLTHTVLTSLCTGCELCVSPCPVDCIRLVPAAQTVHMLKGYSQLEGK